MPERARGATPESLGPRHSWREAGRADAPRALKCQLERSDFRGCRLSTSIIG
jgi:hypothetical protein